MKINQKSLVIIAIVLVLLWFVFSKKSPGMHKALKSEKYTLESGDLAPSDLSGTGIDLSNSCAMKAGTGLSSSLLPREVASSDDFGQFAPDDILKGQNFLDPRSQIGWPETIGGTLRNANQSERAEPPNPKSAYTWNNSTIVPDLMQRTMC
jgi:hypothetical protein